MAILSGRAISHWRTNVGPPRFVGRIPTRGELHIKSKGGFMGSKSYLPKGFAPKTGSDVELYEKISRYIREHTRSSFTQCMNDLKINTKPWTFYRIRDALKKEGINIPSSPQTGVPKTTTSKKHGIYMKVFTHPAKDVPQSAKDLLKNFIECLNSTKRTHMELVEYVNPPELEVREIR